MVQDSHCPLNFSFLSTLLLIRIWVLQLSISMLMQFRLKAWCSCSLIPRYFLPFSFSFDFPPFLFFSSFGVSVFLFIFVFNYCQCSWLEYISTCVCCLSKKIMIFVHEFCLGFYWTHVCVWLPQHCTFKGLNLGQVCVKPFFLLFFVVFVVNFHSLFFTKFKESFFQFIYFVTFVGSTLSIFFHVGEFIYA